MANPKSKQRNKSQKTTDPDDANTRRITHALPLRSVNTNATEHASSSKATWRIYSIALLFSKSVLVILVGNGPDPLAHRHENNLRAGNVQRTREIVTGNRRSRCVGAWHSTRCLIRFSKILSSLRLCACFLLICDPVPWSSEDDTAQARGPNNTTQGLDQKADSVGGAAKNFEC